VTAWQIGYGSRNADGLDPADGGGLGAYIGRVIAWVPADVIALYGVVITALQATDSSKGSNPSVAMLVLFIILAPVVTWLAALSAKHFTYRDVAAGVLAFVAFGIWSTSVPQSGWGHFKWVQHNPVQLAIFGAVAGLLFGLIASIVSNLVPKDPILFKKSA
jgi:hypothetical protein